MRIAIFDLTLQTGRTFEGFPTVGQTIIDWLAPALPEAKLVPIPIAYGAPIPPVEKFDGYVLSGSERCVGDDTPWISELRRFLKEAKELQKPIFGICFGHQIIADTFGGRVEYQGQGTQIGLRTFDFKDGREDAIIWHHDQITAVPPGAKVIASTEYCPIAGLEYDFPAKSVQFHPEMTKDLLRRFLAIGPRLIDANLAILAEMSFEQGEARKDLMANAAAQLFRDHVVGEKEPIAS